MSGQGARTCAAWPGVLATLMLASLAGTVHASPRSCRSGLDSETISEAAASWSEGELDIPTSIPARDALLFIFPDGTSLLEDASGKP